MEPCGLTRCTIRYGAALAKACPQWEVSHKRLRRSGDCEKSRRVFERPGQHAAAQPAGDAARTTGWCRTTTSAAVVRGTIRQQRLPNARKRAFVRRWGDAPATRKKRVRDAFGGSVRARFRWDDLVSSSATQMGIAIREAGETAEWDMQRVLRIRCECASGSPKALRAIVTIEERFAGWVAGNDHAELVRRASRPGAIGHSSSWSRLRRRGRSACPRESRR